MLVEKYASLDLTKPLLPHGTYKPFPQATDRTFWDTLPNGLREQLIIAGEKWTSYEWPALPAMLFMENKQNGNRSKYEATFFARRAALGALTMAECAEGKGRFLDNIVNGIWYTCEESSWCIPAHTDTVLPDVKRPVIDLFAAETASMLAWVQYLLRNALDGVSPIVNERIEHEVKLRVMDPYIERDDFWWMGFIEHRYGPVNNWNPWCNSNCLAAFLLLEREGDRQEAALRKCLLSLDIFLNTYHSDGGCDEGTIYWGVAGGALFDCLELLQSITGEAIGVYDEPLIQNIGRFIYRSHVAGEYYINFADGGAKVKIPAELVWRYGQRIGDGALVALGAVAFRLNDMKCPATHFGSLFRPLWGIVNYEKLMQVKSEPPLLRDVWMKDIEVMAARERSGSSAGLYLAVKGGHNSESHNHNDVGSFVVYSDGYPVLIDVGVETYTAQTFSPDRYSIWTMQSQYHNLPTVNGWQQQNGRQYRTQNVRYECEESEVWFEMNIAGAYPEDACIAQWVRGFRFYRKEKAFIEKTDEFKLSEATDNIILNYMTCCEHEIDPTGKIVFHMPGGRDVRMIFDGETYSAMAERIEIHDDQLRSVWGQHVYRIVLKAKENLKQGVARIRVEQE